MNPRIRLLVNAIPMVNVNTGISRYLRSLYAEMERIYGDRLEVGYFSGLKVSPLMPRGPADFNRWAKGVDLFWGMPVYPALFIRLVFHFIREAFFHRCCRHFDLYHEAGFFPFTVPRRLKTVFTIHDLSLIRFPQYHPEERVLYSRFFFRRRCKGVDHFLAVSEFTAGEMRTCLNINPENISVTREAHDDKIFFPRSHEEVKAFLNRYDLPERYFLFVGGGDPRKNLDVVPAALKKADIEVPLVVVGWSGWSHDKSWKKVIPLGYVSDDEMARVYSGALALIFPSIYEGFGLPILEAMACDCPVVTTREASLPEVAGEGVKYMKSPRDVDDLAGILRDLSGDPAMRQRLRDEGQARARRFSWEETARTTFEAFERVFK